jgi:Nucleotidyl transferase AbiEii toxin, Type IV TA system
MLRRYERGWHYRDSLAIVNAEEQGFIDSLIATYGSWLAGAPMERVLHQQIIAILGCLNREFLRGCRVYLGGGTLLVLRYGEYRLSQNIDLLCSSSIGYRQLRSAILTDHYSALFQNQDNLTFSREIQANQYGVRFPVVIDGQTIRLEIVSEGRIELGEPIDLDWCPVATLNDVDIVAEKLLANSDRWPDQSVLSRDLIDLAMLRSQGELPAEAIAKAEAAYPVLEPLRRSIAWFQDRPEVRSRCYELLQVRDAGPIEAGLILLAADFS